MATRLLDQLPQYRLADGTLCAGGSLEFYITATTTPKNVYNGPDLGTSLGSSLTLDAAARTSVDVWLDGAYKVILKDADGATVWTRNDTRDTVAATYYAIPDPNGGTDGQYIATDGTDYYLEDLIAVPTPSGHSGQYLTNDGAVLSWASLPTYSETSLPAGITQDGTSLQIGKFKIQTGSGTAPTAAAQTTSLAVTFPEAYTTLLHVDINPTIGAVTGESGGVETSYTGSITGFTARFIAPDMGAVSGSENITSAVTFTWVAFGIVA